jgi:hypothetical protein
MASSTLFLAACGSSSLGAGGGANLPPGQPTIVTSGVFPAIHPALPTMVSAGGPVMTAPHLTIVTFSGANNVQDLEIFGTKLPSSIFVGMLQKEYGIGALTVTSPVTGEALPPPPSTGGSATMVSGDDIETLLQTELGKATPTWPLPTNGSNPVYALFFPPNVTIAVPARAGSDVVCQNGVVGYHLETTVDVNQVTMPISYAVIGQCTNTSALNDVTAIASHEIAETFTDPFPLTAAAYGSFDTNHLAWGIFGSEIGDYCANVSNNTYLASDIGYYVQRLWSNSAVAAGHDPCSPEPSGEIYFNTAPLLVDPLSINGTSTTTLGVAVPLLGKIVKLQPFSEAAVGPWQVDLVDLLANSSNALQVSLDRSQGQNGNQISMTFPPQGANSGRTYQIAVRSTLNDQIVLWPFFVAME